MIQSNLHNGICPALFESEMRFRDGPSYGAIKRLTLIYLALWALALLLFPVWPVLSLGLIFPGGGFLTSGSPLIFTGLSLGLFGLAVFLWFATGNAIGPVAVWALSFCAAPFLMGSNIMPGLSALLLLSPVLVALFWGGRFGLWQTRRRRLKGLNTEMASAAPRSSIASPPAQSVLCAQQMAGLRFLLDRALQPVDRFDGFEHRDPFQTAALRYQVNFIAYALSLVQMNYLPALGGYLTEAQRRLKAKQENPKIWRYWQAENIWGNLALDRDPVARDNIMYSGFVATQMMMALKTAPHPNPEFMNTLSGEDRGYGFRYDRAALIQTLNNQYEDAPFGLLPCEPNWIYPLCNFITASAMAAYDTQFGTAHWAGVKDNFRRLCEQEFMGVDGHFIAFRSSYTGMASPQVGGLVMKTFPCFFLNALFPDMARRQWWLTRKFLQNRSLRKACWPVDVGNYHYSRAAAYGASALAAAEMGDEDLRLRLLALMAADCDPVQKDGRFYYRQGSIWANANAFAASVTAPGSFCRLVNRQTTRSGAYIKQAEADAVLFSAAYNKGAALSFTAHPQGRNGYTPVTIGGLRPGRAYQLLHPGGETPIIASRSGEADLNLPLFEPTEFLLSPGA